MPEPQPPRITDIRFPTASIDPTPERWSQWSSPAMIELSAADTCLFIKTQLPRPELRILEIGCGSGYLSLELARAGHTVIGLDRSPEIIQLAQRSYAAHPNLPGFGDLTYVCADFDSWPTPTERFDAVIVNRALHHLDPLPPLLAKVSRLLTSTGLFLCQDYAYDRLNEQTASWLYSMWRLLFLSGLAPDDPTASISALRTAWFQRAEQHHLNRYDNMIQALAAHFTAQSSSWVPYLFVYIGNTIRHATPEQERDCLTFLRRMEQHLIDQAFIQAVGFRYVGQRR